MFETIPDCGGPVLHERPRRLTKRELDVIKLKQDNLFGLKPFKRKRYFSDGRLTKGYHRWWSELSRRRNQ
jgi:hypothetical protein